MLPFLAGASTTRSASLSRGENPPNVVASHTSVRATNPPVAPNRSHHLNPPSYRPSDPLSGPPPYTETSSPLRAAATLQKFDFDASQPNSRRSNTIDSSLYDKLKNLTMGGNYKGNRNLTPNLTPWNCTDIDPSEDDLRLAYRAIFRMLNWLLESPDQVLFRVRQKRPPGDPRPGKLVGLHLEDFIKHVFTVADMPGSVLITSGVYMHRLMAAYPLARATEGGAHRLFLSALILAAKYHEDITYTNDTWAKIAEYFPAREICQCEIELLKVLDFKLAVSRQEYCRTLHWMRETGAEKAEAPVESLPQVPLPAVNSPPRLTQTVNAVVSPRSANSSFSDSSSGGMTPSSDARTPNSSASPNSPNNHQLLHLDHMMLHEKPALTGAQLNQAQALRVAC